MLVLALLTVGGLMSWFVHELREWENLATRLTRLSLEATLDGIFHSSLTRATSEAVSFIVTSNQSYAQEATDALLYAQSAMTQLRRINAERAEAGGDPRILSLRHNQEELLTRVRRSVTQSLRSRSVAPDKAATERLENLFSPESDKDTAWQAVVSWHDQERRALNQLLRVQRHNLTALAAVTLIISTLWAILIRMLVIRDLVAPLREVAELSKRLADGDLSAPVPESATGDHRLAHEALAVIAEKLKSHEPVSSFTAAVEPEPEPLPEEDPPARAQGPRRALLLAPDAAERELIRAMLQHFGLQVEVAKDAAEAAQLAKAGDFGVVVADRGGDEQPLAPLLSQEAGKKRLAQTPLVLVGATDDPNEPPAWLRPGFDGYLKKPLSFFDLHAALTRLFPGT